jgi:hypothetical protein
MGTHTEASRGCITDDQYARLAVSPYGNRRGIEGVFPMPLVLRRELEPAPEKWGKDEVPAWVPPSAGLRNIHSLRRHDRTHFEAFHE